MIVHLFGLYSLCTFLGWTSDFDGTTGFINGRKLELFCFCFYTKWDGCWHFSIGISIIFIGLIFSIYWNDFIYFFHLTVSSFC